MKWLGVKSWGNTQPTGMMGPCSRYNLELYAYLPPLWFKHRIKNIYLSISPSIKPGPSLHPVQHNVFIAKGRTLLLEKNNAVWQCARHLFQFPFYKIGIIIAVPTNSQGHWKDQIRQWMWKYLQTAKLLLLSCSFFELLSFSLPHSLIARLVRISRYRKSTLIGFWRGR